MRKTLEVMSLIVLGYLCWITYSAMNGPERLPDRIPTHFGALGQPNGWGPLSTLWLLPIIGAGLYVLMTVLSSIRFRRYNLPVRLTEANPAFIQEQTGVMITLIKCEVLGLFAYLQWSIIRGARSGVFGLSPLVLPVFLLVIFATVGWHLMAIVRGAREHPDAADIGGRD